MTAEKIEAVLAAGVADGIYEVSHVDEYGKKHYRLTEKGKRMAEDVFRSHGVDPNNKEAVRAFLGLPDPGDET